MTNSLFLKKVFKTLLPRNIKFLGNVSFGVVVKGLVEKCLTVFGIHCNLY